MNFATLTLEDCIYIKAIFGLDTIIMDGEVKGFDKVEITGSSQFHYFSFGNRKSD